MRGFLSNPGAGASPAAFAANGAGLAGGNRHDPRGRSEQPNRDMSCSAADLGGDAEDDDADPFTTMRGELAALRGGLTVAPTQSRRARARDPTRRRPVRL